MPAQPMETARLTAQYRAPSCCTALVTVKSTDVNYSGASDTRLRPAREGAILGSVPLREMGEARELAFRLWFSLGLNAGGFLVVVSTLLFLFLEIVA